MKARRVTLLTSSLSLAVTFALGAQTATSGDLLPPNAKPGECFARVLVPAQYRSSSAQMLKTGQQETIRIIPARFGPSTQRVLVKEATTRLEVIPATYTWIAESVLVKPASTRLVQIPASYETITERVLVHEAYTTWKKGAAPVSAASLGGLGAGVGSGESATVKVNAATGEVMCLVEVPAEYRTVTKRVVKSPPFTREIAVPAEYKIIRKQALATPATTREVQVPAEYQTVTTTVELQPAREVRDTIPESYETVTKTEKISDERIEWHQILCATNATPARISSIQQALKTAGFYAGPADGSLGPTTMTAVARFQRAKSLPVDGYLNMETVKALGVN